MTITLPTASATYDGAVINFFRTGGTNTLTINSASSNIYNNALTLTNVILLSRQYSRSIICQANNGVYAWYYADSDSILYSANTWYGANTYTVNPTFASNRQLYYLDAVNNVIGVGNSTSTAGTNNLYCGTQSGAGNTASYNACYGFQTLSRGGTLQGFCVFGYRSGADFVSGSLNNVAIGIFSGLGAVNGDSECTYIGNGSGSDGLARYDNSIAIGRYAKVFASNVLVFGGTDGIYGYPVSYFMGGCVVPATKNLNLLGCFISATQSFLVNSSTISLTGGKTIYVGSAVTELFLPLPSASDVGKIFTIVKNGSGGGTLWGLALRRPTLTTFTISANGFNGNTAYSMGVSEFSVDIMVIGSTAAGVCYTIIYNNPDLIRTETVFSSAFFLPPQSVVPATRSQINTIVIGQDALITVTSSTHSLSNTVIGTAAGKLIQSTPAALTIIGREAYGQATNLGSGCSSLGYRSGWDITTGASTNLTMIGTTTSVSSPTTAYNQSSCFGFGSTITRSNECVLATASETVYVPGTLQAQNNYIASASPTLITTTTTLSGVLYRYYSITTDGGSYSITLPTASVSYLGCSVTFRRVGSNSNNTLTSASSNIYQRNIFSPNNMLLDDGIYQCTIVCMVLSATPTYGWFVITD
jgi:hypothetical protein